MRWGRSIRCSYCYGIGLFNAILEHTNKNEDKVML